MQTARSWARRPRRCNDVPLEFTSKGYIEVYLEGVFVSRHRIETEAVESIVAHSEANGDGTYRITYPEKSVVARRIKLVPVPASGKPSQPTLVVTHAPIVDPATTGTAVLTWSAAAPASGTTVASYTVYQGGVAVQSGLTGLTASVTGLSAGVLYSFTVTATSNQGLESLPSNACLVSWPSWTDSLGNTFSVPQNTPFSYTFSAADLDGDAVPFSYDNVPPGITVTPGVQSGTTREITISSAGLSADSYTVSVDLQPLVTATDLTTLTLLASSTDASAPWMAGVAFAKGAVPAGVGLVTSEASSSVVVKRRWNDGSAKHAVVCGLSSLTAGVGKQVSLQAGTRGGTALTAASIQAAAPTASVQLGANGTVMLGSLLASPFRTWVSTPDMVECHYRASVTADLAVWFHVRLWSNGRLWVRAIAENGYTTGSPTTQAYVATVIIGGSTVYSASVNHYAFTRWTATGWVGTAATVRTAHVPAELIATRLVPNYWKRSPSATKLNAQVRTYAPMQLSPQPVSMGDAGFGEYIGVLPNWSALFVTSADARAYDATLVASNTLNSYSICRRSAATNRLSRPSDFPTFGLGEYSSSNPLGAWEVAHLVNEGYAAYLATGDYWHLETLGFNASYCYLTISTTNGQGVNKILRGETRAVGWMLNVVGHYCSIAPVEGEAAADSAIVSDYQTLLANNVAHWSSQIGVSGQNQLGSPYQYSLGAWSGTGSVAPWMTDFWVIVNGALCKMDPLPTMTSWQALRDWMYRWIVGRFGPTGSENFHFSRGGSEYGINISASNLTDPTTFFDSWGAVWTATFGSPNAETTNTLYSTNPGASNDPAYASGNHRWGVAVAAFAYAVDDSASGVSAAWSRFTGASNWSAIEGSNFSDVPLWGIVPSGYGGT